MGQRCPTINQTIKSTNFDRYGREDRFFNRAGLSCSNPRLEIAKVDSLQAIQVYLLTGSPSINPQSDRRF